MIITKVTSVTDDLLQAVNRLLGQLTDSGTPITRNGLEALVEASNSHLFVATDADGTVTGMITLGIYRAPTGCKGWIEDVVVDDAYRGRGLGRLLTRYAVAYAEKEGVNLLSLTSNPSRIAANRLYPEVGFSRKETNVYVMRFGSPQS